MNEDLSRLKDVKIENYIWIIYIGIIVLSWYANSKEKNYILTHTSIDEDTYEKCIDSDYWLTADQALEYHIVDSIIGVESDEK